METKCSCGEISSNFGWGFGLGIALAFDENELPAFWRENLGGIPFYSIPDVVRPFAGWLKNNGEKENIYVGIPTTVRGWLVAGEQRWDVVACSLSAAYQ